MIKQRHIFYGWWVIVGLFIIGMFGPVGRYSMTAFLPFITTELGWSRATIGLAQSLTLWLYALFVLLSGSMVDRIGSRKTLFIGGIITLAGWMLLSTMKSPWQLYLYYGVLMALAVSMTHVVTTVSTGRKWFRKRGGLVAGIIITGSSTGIAIFMPLITSFAASQGWRFTSVICGLSFSIIIMLVAFFIIRDTPESMGLHPDGENAVPSAESSAIKEVSWSIKEAIRTPQLWLLFLAYSMYGIPFNGILSFIVIWGVDLGSSKAIAGVFMTFMTASSIVFKITGGWLGDKYGKKRFMLISQILGALVMLFGWQAVHTTQSLMVFVILMGIAYGISLGLWNPYLGDLFGRAYVGSLFGIITLGFGIIGGCGPLIWGKVYDTSGSYNLACLISVVCYAIAAIAIFCIRPPKDKKGSLES